MTLDEAIRAAAKRGDISHLTLAPRHDKNNLVSWQAGFRHVDAQGYVCEIADDPVEALLSALSASKPSRRKATKKPREDFEDIL